MSVFFRIFVDDEPVEVAKGLTVFQACRLADKEIPHFCYHPRLAIAGNCRMCLVEVEKAPKLVASCAMPVADGMKIYTNTQRVKTAREGVMEFLLINHPLDCPICDQGGECDLQDQAMAYGAGLSRYNFEKRAVEEKEMGPLIATAMTRCIHCTRCIRFCEEVAGTPVMGALNRGEEMEISTLEKAVDSELSGNVIDLCPVGALNSKPYLFTARSWELRKTETIDAMDGLGANVRVDVRGGVVMRILPLLNEAINEEWITDKTRFCYDGLKNQRLDVPYVRKGGRLEAVSWQEALEAIGRAMEGVEPLEVGGIGGDLSSVEDYVAFQELMKVLGTPHGDCRPEGCLVPGENAAYWRFNSGIRGLEEADCLLLVGTNPRKESAVLNARIRKQRLRGVPVGVIGVGEDLRYDYEHVSSYPSGILDLLGMKHSFAGALRGARKPMVIVGLEVFRRRDREAILHNLSVMMKSFGVCRKDWVGYNVLQTTTGLCNGLEVGFVPGAGGRDTAGILQGVREGSLKVVFLMGYDEVAVEGEAFVVYQGSHGDVGAESADVVLPAAAWAEKTALWVNTEGRVQQGIQALNAPGEALEDWQIAGKVAAVLGKRWRYSTALSLQEAFKAQRGRHKAVDWDLLGKEGKMVQEPFKPFVEDFYLTNVIARASETLSKCSAIFSTKRVAV